MKTILCLFLFAFLTACGALSGGSYTLNASSITVQRGSSVRVGVIAPGLQLAPAVTAQATNSSGGLKVEVAGSAPNPAEVRALISVTAALDAPLGQQSVLVTFPTGSATLSVNVTALGNLKPVRGGGRTTTVASGQRVIVWIKNDGSVWERRVGGASSAVPGIGNAKAVGLIDCCGDVNYTAVAATADGTVWTWNAATAPQQVGQVAGGAVDLSVSPLASFALAGDGRAWRLNLEAGKLAATLEPGVADVAAIRVTSSARFYQTTYAKTIVVTYLLMTGTVQRIVTYEEIDSTIPGPPPPIKRTVTNGSTDIVDVGNAGFAQRSDGRVYTGNYRVHDTPVKHFESSYDTAQTNSTNSTTSLSAFCLFADGGLWQTAITQSFSEGQAGNPLASGDTIQRPMNIPNTADVLDFALLGNGIVIWTADGVYFAATPPVSSPTVYDFQPIDLPDVRRPGS